MKTYMRRVLEELKVGGPATSREMAAVLEIPVNRACAYLCQLEACGLVVVEKIMEGQGSGPARKLGRAA